MCAASPKPSPPSVDLPDAVGRHRPASARLGGMWVASALWACGVTLGTASCAGEGAGPPDTQGPAAHRDVRGDGAVSDVAAAGGEGLDPLDVATVPSEGDAARGGGADGVAPLDAADPGGADAGAAAPDAGPADVAVVVPDADGLAEETDHALPVDVTAPASARVWALDLPPGARWHEPSRTLHFRPDFTQGGQGWTVTVVVDAGGSRTEWPWPVTVADTISPPAPTVAASAVLGDVVRHDVAQALDPWLGSPSQVAAGTTYDAVVLVPASSGGAASVPLRVRLHGFGGAPPDDGWAGEVRLSPHDPDNTYWWGHCDSWPSSAPKAGDTCPPYAQRRVLHLVDWVLSQFPAADPERVHVEGASMGGAGAAAFGLLHARHVAYVRATIFQAIPRNHRPSRLAQLSGIWGPPGLTTTAGTGFGMLSPWDAGDVTRILEARPEARHQWLFVEHGKDDPIIHFGAVVHPSPLTGRTAYEAFAEARAGLLAVWHEGAHGTPDPLLGALWWDTGFDPVFDAVTQARRSSPFVAFHAVSTDRDPGHGEGNGAVPWNEESGYAGSAFEVGDTGWEGDRAGCLGRAVRFRSADIVDTLGSFGVALRALDGDGVSPAPGEPIVGDPPLSTDGVTVEATPRRLQRFQLAPGETVSVSWAGQGGPESGTVTADAYGTVTVPGLVLDGSWRWLGLTRL